MNALMGAPIVAFTDMSTNVSYLHEMLKLLVMVYTEKSNDILFQRYIQEYLDQKRIFSEFIHTLQVVESLVHLRSSCM